MDVNGGGATPVYKFLKDNAKVSSIPWNFSKFLINADGDVVAYYPPQSQVDDIKKDIKQMIWVQELKNKISKTQNYGDLESRIFKCIWVLEEF